MTRLNWAVNGLRWSKTYWVGLPAQTHVKFYKLLSLTKKKPSNGFWTSLH